MQMYFSQVSSVLQRLRFQCRRLMQISHRDIPSGQTQSPLLSKIEIAGLRKQALAQIGVRHQRKTVLERHHGENRSPTHGAGLDFEESRAYQPGDELRFMNWRITARTNEPHVKVFREERHPSAFILLDRRQSMRFGTRSRLKVTQALRMAALQAFYLHYQGWRISSALLENNLHWLDTVDDEQGLLTLIDIMNTPCPPQTNKKETISLAQTLRHLLDRLSEGSHLFLISDFSGMTNDCRSLLSALAERYNVTAFHIIDPAEITLPHAGHIQLSSKWLVETDNTTRTINTSDSNVEKRYNELIQQHLMQCETLIRSCDARYFQLLTTVENIESDYIQG